MGSPAYNLYLPTFIHFSIVFFLMSISELNLLEFLGLNFSLAATEYFLSSFIEIIYNTWLGIYLGHNTDLREMGSWAVVTGATDGIGLAYCEQLAMKGINIVLMSRSIDKLINCAKALELKYNISTKIIQIDFSEDVDTYDKVELALGGMDIGTLINNVGMTYPRPTLFHELKDSKKFIHDMLNINALSVAMMSRAVLPGMLDRGKGVIVNVGSYVSCNHAPYFALYGASKCFVEKFTQDLSNEYKGSGVIFQYQLPGYVTTKLSKISKPSLGTPSAEQYARWGIKLIGLQTRTAVWIPHRVISKCFYFLQVLYPRRWAEFSTDVMRTFWLFAKKREIEKLNGVKSYK